MAKTSLGPVVENSSNPSAPWTTKPLCRPIAESVTAINSAATTEGAPTNWQVAPAGFVNGPSRLNAVRVFSSALAGWAWRMAGCNAGAKRKPKPISLMARPMSSGRISNFAPNASRRSADPHRLDIDRLPCLATLTPAPATTKATTVDTFSVPWLSPPVPQVSSTGSPVTPCSTRTPLSRIASANPCNSSAVSPFIRSAVAKAAI